ncbi:MAG TPA: DUF3152 domain-containing protein [Micromonosporaceae bacterium]
MSVYLNRPVEPTGPEDPAGSVGVAGTAGITDSSRRRRLPGTRWLLSGPRRRRRVTLASVLVLALASPLMVTAVEAATNLVVGASAGQPSAPALVRGNDWYLRNTLSGGAPEVSFRFGLPSDHPLFGDWDGDGTATPGLFRNGQWLLRNRLWGGSVDRTVSFGRPGDIPVVGDWDGDGDDDIAAFRAGRWLFDLNLTGGAEERTARFGRPTDSPVAGDWNGTADGSTADLPGLRRGGRWYLATEQRTGGYAGTWFSYGTQAGDVPVVGRWQDGAGIDQVGVVRGLEWQLRYAHSTGAADAWFSYGQAGDFFLTRGGSPASLSQPVRHYTYRVGIKGDVGNQSLEHFADVARETLNDQRGWSLGRHIRFSRIHSGTPSLNIWLASPQEVAAADPICDEEWSCRVGDNVYINITRWNNGTTTWSSRPLSEYRQYVFNHEVGHWMGFGHASCPSSGAAAPVMMQQSINLYGCVINLWPSLAEKQRAYDIHIGSSSLSASLAEAEEASPEYASVE